MRMLFLTDLHESVVYLRAVQRRVLEAGWRPDLVVVGGDISSFGGVAQARPLLNFIRSTWDRVLAVAGNTDLPEVAEWLGSLGVDLAGRGLVVGDVGFVGCQGSNWTPLGTPNERSEGGLDRSYPGPQSRAALLGPVRMGRAGEGAAVCHRESVHLPAWRRMPSALREGSRKLAGFLRWKVSVARSRAG